MKRKTLTLTLVLLSCLALIGVGFASWIISANTTEELEGNISVDMVIDNRLKVTGLDWIGEKKNVQYGYAGTAKDTDWLKVSDDAVEENLLVTLEFTVTDAGGKAVTGLTTSSISAKVTPQTKLIGDVEKDVYNDLLGEKIVGALPTMENDGIKLTEKGNGKYELAFQFKWGDVFKNTTGVVENPYVFFNSKEYGSTLTIGENTVNVEKAALDLLTALKELNTVAFNVELTIAPIK